MNYSTEKPGRVIGGVIVLQAIVAQLLASHPDGEGMLKKFGTFSIGLEPTPDTPPESFDFLADLSAGAQDTIDEIQNLIELGGGFRK